MVGFGKILHCMELIGRIVGAVWYHLYHAIEAVYYAMLWRQYAIGGRYCGDRWAFATCTQCPAAKTLELQFLARQETAEHTKTAPLVCSEQNMNALLIIITSCH